MSDTRNVAVSEGLWVRLKQRALDERVTLREVTEWLLTVALGPSGALREVGEAGVAARWQERTLGKRQELQTTPEEPIP